MQGMASELNMYESQVQEYKYEIEHLARELHVQDVKKKYYTQKRKEQQQRLVSSESEKLNINLLLELTFISNLLFCIAVPTTFHQAGDMLDWSCASS